MQFDQYIALDSPQYARRMMDRLTRRTLQIAQHPFSGRKVPEYDFKLIREVIEGPYRIIYLMKSDQIDILAINPWGHECACPRMPTIRH
jgi:toxin ParE1/3/4